MNTYYARPKLSAFKHISSYEELEQKLTKDTKIIHTILENLSEPGFSYRGSDQPSRSIRPTRSTGDFENSDKRIVLHDATLSQDGQKNSKRYPTKSRNIHEYVIRKPAEVGEFNKQGTPLIAFTGSEYSKEVLQTRGYEVLDRKPDSDELILPQPTSVLKSPGEKKEQYYKKNINFNEEKAALFDLRNVKVLIIDSGLDLKHPEFRGITINMPESCDFGQEDFIRRGVVTKHPYNGGEIYQKHYHGTAVSSLVCGNTHGVARGVELVVYNVTYDQDALTRTRFEKAILYAGVCRPDIILMSWGINGNNPVFMDDIDYIQECCDDSTVIVAAIGNDGPNTHYSPSDYPNVLAVGATDENNELWTKSDGRGSSFGAYNMNNEKIIKPDIYAPGVNLQVAVPIEISKSGYQQYSGTSFSAPLVVGVVAYAICIMKMKKKEFTASQIKETIIKTGRDFKLPSSYGSENGKLIDFSEVLQAF